MEAADSGSLELTPKTITTTRSAVRVMSDAVLADTRRFGSIRLSQLTSEDIEGLYAALRLSGRGPDWIRRCATVLTCSLELARKRGLIDSNPSKDAVRPKSTRKKPYAPLADDVRRTLDVAAQRDPEMADMAIVLARTGVREGELLGVGVVRNPPRAPTGGTSPCRQRHGEVTLRLHEGGRTGVGRCKAISEARALIEKA